LTGVIQEGNTASTQKGKKKTDQSEDRPVVSRTKKKQMRLDFKKR